MEFEIYLADKKIDSQAFRANEPGKWQEFMNLFEKVHPNSFTVQKKFLINDIRRAYPLPLQAVPIISPVVQTTDVAKPAKPVIKRPVIVKKPDTET